MVQDLSLGESRNVAVETGDSLEMKYTGWLVTKDGSLGTMFDSNHNSEKTFRFKTGRGKVIKVSFPVFFIISLNVLKPYFEVSRLVTSKLFDSKTQEDHFAAAS